MTELVVVPLGEGLEFRVVDVDAVEPHPDNPNVEDLAVFNDLAAGMKKDGFLEPVLLVPHGEGRWRLIAGEHRWKAAKLAGMTAIPALVKLDWDETEGMAQLVRMNIVRGKLDPERFTKLYEKLKGQVPEEEQLRKRMGFGARDAEFRRMMRATLKGLPKEIADDVAKRADKIRRVEDLATVVQSMFAKHGGTIDCHFIAFSFGGQTHLMIRASAETFAPIRVLAEACQAAEVELDAVLAAKAACACADCVQLTTIKTEATG